MTFSRVFTGTIPFAQTDAQLATRYDAVMPAVKAPLAGPGLGFELAFRLEVLAPRTSSGSTGEALVRLNMYDYLPGVRRDNTFRADGCAAGDAV
jgi:hypothetical protein